MRSSVRVFALGVVLSLCVSILVPAQCVVDISTGFDAAAGAVIVEGKPDDSYTVDDGTGPQPALTGGAAQGFPVAQGLFNPNLRVQNRDTSLWISSGADANAAPGTYTYEIRFELSADPDVSTLTIFGSYAVGGELKRLVVNGTSVSVSVFPPLPGLMFKFSRDTAAGLFREGENVIQFLVRNIGRAPNPTGLRVNACVGVAPRPEGRPIDISTGFDDAAVAVIDDGAADDEYIVTGPEGSGIGPARAVTLVDKEELPFAFANMRAKWIGPRGDANSPRGVYVYSTRVEIPAGFRAAVAVMSGSLSTDESLTDILVNGKSTGIAGFEGRIGLPGGMRLPDRAGLGLFVAGPNTLEFLVENASDGPTGLRVDGEIVPFELRPWQQRAFRRGDVDGSGRINLADPIHVFEVLLGDRGRTLACDDAGDADDNGKLQLADGVCLLTFLFERGAPPPAPYPSCGEDPTGDTLSCNALSVPCRNELLAPFFASSDAPEAFAFVIDRSGSAQNSGELDFSKAETIRRIEAFPDDTEFAVIFLDRGVLQYPEDGVPMRATAEQKEAAAEWITGVPGGGGSCPEESLVAALTALGQSAAEDKRIVYFGDGGATCEGGNEQEVMARTLETIAAQNTEGVVIHAVGVQQVGSVQRNFLQALVDAHGGLLVEVTMTRKELSDAARRNRRIPYQVPRGAQVLKGLDTNQDGNITREEMRELPEHRPAGLIDRLITRGDQDGDLALSRKEFLDATAPSVRDRIPPGGGPLAPPLPTLPDAEGNQALPVGDVLRAESRSTGTDRPESEKPRGTREDSMGRSDERLERPVKLDVASVRVESLDEDGLKLGVDLEGRALTTATHFGAVTINSAMDDEGQALNLSTTFGVSGVTFSRKGAWFRSRSFTFPRSGSYDLIVRRLDASIDKLSLQLRFAPPARTASRLKMLEGTLELVFPGRREEVLLDEIQKSVGRKLTDDRLEAAGLSLKLFASRDDPSRVDRVEFYAERKRDLLAVRSIQLLNAADEEIAKGRQRGIGVVGNVRTGWRQAEAEYLLKPSGRLDEFSNARGNDGTKEGRKLRLIIEPGQTFRQAPFTLRDVPLTSSEKGTETPVKVARPVSRKTFQFQCTVLSNGEPIEGASVMATPVIEWTDGRREVARAFRNVVYDRSTGRFSMPRYVRADANGRLTSMPISYSPDEVNATTLFTVGAYHEEYGSEQQELPMEKLQRAGAEDIVFDLKRRAVVKGRIVDRQGNPMPGVGVSVVGYVQCLSKEGGRFEIAGIPPGFLHPQVYTIYREPIPLPKDSATGAERLDWLRLISLSRVDKRHQVKEGSFDEATQTWNLGDITPFPDEKESIEAWARRKAERRLLLKRIEDREMPGREGRAALESPQNLVPSQGVTVEGVPVVLRSSVFGHRDPTVNHRSTRWQMRAVDGTYDTSPTMDFVSGKDLERFVVPEHLLFPRTKYYWRVSYTTSTGEVSKFSAETSFTTGQFDVETVRFDLAEVFNRDVVADFGDTANDYFDGGMSCLIEEGFDGSRADNPEAHGLPHDRIVGVHHLAEYGSLNALQASAQSGEEVRLRVPPRSYSSIRFLVSGGHGDSEIPIVFEYSDGTSESATLHCDDWFDDSPPDPLGAKNPEAVPIVNGMDRWFGRGFQDVNDPALFEIVLLSDPLKKLDSIVFDLEKAVYGQPAQTRFNLFAATGVLRSKTDVGPSPQAEK